MHHGAEAELHDHLIFFKFGNGVKGWEIGIIISFYTLCPTRAEGPACITQYGQTFSQSIQLMKDAHTILHDRTGTLLRS